MNPLRRLVANEDLNFLLTNRIPRILLTRWMGWFSQIRRGLQPAAGPTSAGRAGQIGLSQAHAPDTASA